MNYNLETLRGDLSGGITATVVALPVALAFGVASGLGAGAGLYGAIAVGFFASVFGGARAVAVKSQPTAENGEVVVAQLEDEVALKRYVRLDERRVELRPESTNPGHQPIEVDLKEGAFESAGIAVGALIGDGFNAPEYESWVA